MNACKLASILLTQARIVAVTRHWRLSRTSMVASDVQVTSSVNSTSVKSSSSDSNGDFISFTRSEISGIRPCAHIPGIHPEKRGVTYCVHAIRCSKDANDKHPRSRSFAPIFAGCIQSLGKQCRRFVADYQIVIIHKARVLSAHNYWLKTQYKCIFLRLSIIAANRGLCQKHERTL